LLRQLAHLFREVVYLQLKRLLVGEQLGVVGLQQDVLVQRLRVFLRQEVDGFLQLGQHVDFPLPPGGEPGHHGPDRAAREQKHQQILQYLEIHHKRPFNAQASPR